MSWLLRTGSLVPRLAGSVSRRLYSGTGEKTLTEGEKAIRKVLDERFKQATFINVEDISGGCGSMYEIQIESPEFKGKRTVMQHRMVNEALKEQIKDMHGLRISTAVPEGT